VYYKLARISAKKGFKSDARKNFLEYADRMQKLGMADEAFRALKEFASLYPDQDDVRLVLAELLSKENRKGEAIEQLQSLYEKLQAEGRSAEARATVDRMRAIDPNVTPREGKRNHDARSGRGPHLPRPVRQARPKMARRLPRHGRRCPRRFQP
jgi:tetratricopeptide (TPR) repeat protein